MHAGYKVESNSDNMFSSLLEIVNRSQNVNNMNVLLLIYMSNLLNIAWKIGIVAAFVICDF